MELCDDYFNLSLLGTLNQCIFVIQELRFIISSVPIFNLSAAIAANRMYVMKCSTKLFLSLLWGFFPLV